MRGYAVPCSPACCCLLLPLAAIGLTDVPACRVGQVKVTPLTTKRVEHSGIKIKLVGQIELASERGTYHDFVSLGACS